MIDSVGVVRLVRLIWFGLIRLWVWFWCFRYGAFSTLILLFYFITLVLLLVCLPA